MSEGVTIIDCVNFPEVDYLGNRVVRTDEMVESLGSRLGRARAERFAERHRPQVPFYHLRVEPAGRWRWAVNVYQNRAEPKEPEVPHA